MQRCTSMNNKPFGRNIILDLGEFLFLFRKYIIWLIILTISAIIWSIYSYRNMPVIYRVELAFTLNKNFKEYPPIFSFATNDDGYWFLRDKQDCFPVFLEKFYSVDNLSRLSQDLSLLQTLYPSEWNEEKGLFEKREPSTQQIVVRLLKKILLGDSYRYLPPGPERLQDNLRRRIKFTYDSDKKIYVVRITSSKPSQDLFLLHNALDSLESLNEENYNKRFMDLTKFYSALLKSKSKRVRDNTSRSMSLITADAKLGTPNQFSCIQLLTEPKPPYRQILPSFRAQIVQNLLLAICLYSLVLSFLFRGQLVRVS